MFALCQVEMLRMHPVSVPRCGCLEVMSSPADCSAHVAELSKSANRKQRGSQDAITVVVKHVCKNKAMNR